MVSTAIHARHSRTQFTLSGMFEYTTVCCIVAAFSHLTGVGSAAALMAFALALMMRYGLAALLIRCCKGERKARMLRDECAKLATGIATGAEDADRDSIHTIMHNHAFGSGQSPATCVTILLQLG